MRDNSGDLHELFRSHEIHHMNGSWSFSNSTQQLIIQDAITCMVLITMMHVLTFHESIHIADEIKETQRSRAAILCYTAVLDARLGKI